MTFYGMAILWDALVIHCKKIHKREAYCIWNYDRFRFKINASVLYNALAVKKYSKYRKPAPSVSWDTSSVPVVIARIRGPMGYY